MGHTHERRVQLSSNLTGLHKAIFAIVNAVSIIPQARATANALVATVLGSIPASVDTVESEGRQMKQC